MNIVDCLEFCLDGRQHEFRVIDKEAETLWVFGRAQVEVVVRSAVDELLGGDLDDTRAAMAS